MAKRIIGETPLPEDVSVEKAKMVPEKKETKLEGLERRVLLVRDFYKSVNAIRADLSVEETNTELDRVFQGFFDKAPTALKRRLARHEKDERRRIEIENELDEYSEEEREDFLLGEDGSELDKLESRLGKDRQDYDLVFLLEIKKAVESFKLKKRQVEKARMSPEIIYKLVPPDKIKTIFFKAFEISIVVNADWLKKNRQSEEVRGFHSRNSVISLIGDFGQREVAWSQSELINHESVHNFLDFKREPFETSGFLERWNAAAEDYLEELRSEDSTKSSFEYRRRLLERFNVWRLIDEEHEEILAAMESAENSAFQKSSLANEAIEGKGVPSLSTAQLRINERITFFKKESLVATDPFLKGYFERVSKDLESGFAQVAEQMKRALDIGRRIGFDASEFAHFVFVLLKPSQFGLAERLLAQRYGFQKVEETRQEFLFIERVDFSAKFLREFKERLVSNKKPNPEDVVAVFDRLVVQFENQDFSEIGISSLEDLRTVDRLLWEITPLVSYSGRLANNTKELLSRLYIKYFGEFLDSIPKQRIVEVPAEFLDLSPEEKGEMIKALETQISFVGDDLAEILGKEEITPQDVYKSLFWKIVQLMGVEEKFRPKIERVFAT